MKIVESVGNKNSIDIRDMKYGDVGRVVDSNLSSKTKESIYLMKVYGCWVNLNDPSETWTNLHCTGTRVVLVDAELHITK